MKTWLGLVAAACLAASTGLLAAPLAFAQAEAVQIAVLDVVTREPLGGAAVSIAEPADHCITNAAGACDLEVPQEGRVTITVSAPGYLPQTVALTLPASAEDETLTFVLEQERQQQPRVPEASYAEGITEGPGSGDWVPLSSDSVADATLSGETLPVLLGEGKIRISFSLPGILRRDVEAGEGSGTILSIPNGLFSLEAGKPVIPAMTGKFVMPPGASIVSITATVNETVELEDVEPTLHIPVRITPVGPVQEDIVVEELTSTYPAEFYRVSEVGALRDGNTLGSVSIWPVQFDPTTGSALVHAALELEVVYSVPALVEEEASISLLDDLPDRLGQIEVLPRGHRGRRDPQNLGATESQCTSIIPGAFLVHEDGRSEFSMISAGFWRDEHSAQSSNFLGVMTYSDAEGSAFAQAKQVQHLSDYGDVELVTDYDRVLEIIKQQWSDSPGLVLFGAPNGTGGKLSPLASYINWPLVGVIDDTDLPTVQDLASDLGVSTVILSGEIPSSISSWLADSGLRIIRLDDQKQINQFLHLQMANGGFYETVPNPQAEVYEREIINPDFPSSYSSAQSGDGLLGDSYWYLVVYDATAEAEFPTAAVQLATYRSAALFEAGYWGADAIRTEINNSYDPVYIALYGDGDPANVGGFYVADPENDPVHEPPFIATDFYYEVRESLSVGELTDGWSIDSFVGRPIGSNDGEAQEYIDTLKRYEHGCLASWPLDWTISASMTWPGGEEQTAIDVRDYLATEAPSGALLLKPDSPLYSQADAEFTKPNYVNGSWGLDTGVTVGFAKAHGNDECIALGSEGDADWLCKNELKAHEATWRDWPFLQFSDSCMTARFMGTWDAYDFDNSKNLGCGFIDGEAIGYVGTTAAALVGHIDGVVSAFFEDRITDWDYTQGQALAWARESWYAAQYVHSDWDDKTVWEMMLIGDPSVDVQLGSADQPSGGLPATPTLEAPTNGSTTCDATPLFNWSDSAEAFSYHILIDDDSDFSSPLIDDSTPVSNYTPGSDMLPDTYYWKVAAANYCGESAWTSPAWSVTVSAAPSSAPSLSQPGNGSSSCDNTPFFNWSDVAGATSYRIQVDDSSAFTSPEIDQTASVSDFTPSTGLAPDTYYWRVQGYNSCGDGPWSSPTWTFTVNPQAPTSAPALYDPTNGTATCDSTPAFDWSSVSGATSYRIQVDNSSTFTSPEIDQTTSVSNYTPSTGLAPDTYYWRVQGYNSCGDGPWSSPTWTFTVNPQAPTSAPTLYDPTNGTATCDSTPAFDWSDVSGATSYRIQVDDSSTFTSPEINQTTSVSSYTPSTGLAPDTYYWRVQGYNSCGDGPWSSPTWSFTVNAAPSSAPTLSDPGNGSGTCDSTPNFDWSDVSGATSYRIQVDDSSAFTSPEIDQTTSVSDFTPSTGLAPDTYYWRVQGYNSCGDGPWSSPTWSFTVNSLAPTTAPTLYDPANGTGTCDPTPYFDWSSVAGATSYRLQVDDSSTFTSPVINQTTSVSNYTPSTGLAPDAYYWRVQGYNSCGDGPWSSPTWSFTVNTPAPSTAPTLSDPTNGTATCDPTPAFDWSSVTGATSYRIQVDNDPAFGSPEINVTPSTSYYTPSSDLSPDTYYWRVQGRNSCGDGPWSSPNWSFTVSEAAPSSAPTLYGPSNGASTCDDTPYFGWSDVDGAAFYRLQVDNDSGFGSPEINVTPALSNYTPPSALTPGTYYWRVQASNGCGDGPWSSPTWSFTINTPAPSSAPSLYDPTNGSGTCDATPYFDWSNVTSATYYHIQVDDDSGFGSPTIDDTPSVSNYTPSAGLSSGTYYWRVQGANACGGGPWSSPTWSFMVNEAAPSSAPTLSTPPDTSTTSDDTPSFDWSDVIGATSYRIEVDDDPGFGSPVIDSSPSGSSYTPSSPLVDDTYYWHVRASNGCGDGPWSSPWSFTVDTSTPAVGPVIYDSYTADDDNTGDSSGNGNGVVDCGETIELFVTLANEGTDAATGVSAAISESDPYVALVSNTSSGYPDIPGGGTGTNTDDFEFTVDPATPDAHVIHFDLNITASNGGPWTDSVDVTVSCGNSAPALAWTGESNYVSDGLHPESGGSSDDYVYRIEYSDPDGDPPAYVRVHVKDGGIEILGSPFAMACGSGDYTTGVVCTYTKSGLDEGSDYSYYFEAEDDQGNPATPTAELDAPYVSDSGLPKWTFLVYLIGDTRDPTEDLAILDFLEMSSIGSTTGVNIVVWFDRQGDTFTWQHTHKYYVTEDMTPDPANGVYLGEKDMSDPQTLVDFVQTEKANYPAEHYALIIWDRGSELRRDPPENTMLGDICYDDYPYFSFTIAMSMPELRSALSTITNNGADPLDLLGFDASMMALTEIDNQLRPYADVRVSSQATEPSAGWFYNEALFWLTTIPEMSPTEFAYQIVDWYCPNYGNEPTMSAADLRTPYEDLNTAVDDLADALMAGAATHHADIATARASTQEFPNPDYVDLYDFAHQLNVYVSDAAINAAATAVMDAVDGAVINECGSLTWPDAHGISIYFPESEEDYDDDYDGFQGELLYTAGSPWDEWLHAFYTMGSIAPFPFYDDFESGTLGLGWSTFVTATGRVRACNPPFDYEGSYALCLDNEFAHASDSTSAAILTIDLSGQSEVYLDFWWRDWRGVAQPQDGVFISDDWGQNWHQVYPFDLQPVSWYAHPIIDLAAEAASRGLALNDHFQVKFQAYAREPISSSGTSDGYTVDAVWVDSSPHGVATLPFYDSFESGKQLHDVWQEYEPNCGNVAVVLPEYPHGNCHPHDGEYSLLLQGSDYSCSGNHTAAGILTIDLSGEPDVLLDFWWKEWNDENHPEDGVFISDDQGTTWHRVFSFNDGPSTYRHDVVDIAAHARANGLAFSHIFQIKFQFYGASAYPSDGYSIDEVRLRLLRTAAYAPIMLKSF